MNVFARLGFACASVLVVGMIESQDGAASVRSAQELFSAVSFGSGPRADHSIQLAQLGKQFSVQRPSHETLDLAVRAFGYPVSNASNVMLTLAGMLLLGAVVRKRCRSD